MDSNHSTSHGVIQKIPVPRPNQFWSDIVQFRNTDGGRFADIRIIVAESASERFAQVFRNRPIDANTTHGTDGYCADQGIGI